MKIVYLSPHPDDVAFSCGGSVAADVDAGHDVTLVTLFTERARGAARQREDAVAAARLGARLLALELPDALDRPEVRGQLDIFAPLSQRHLGVLGEAVTRLRPHLPAGTWLRAPLGLGGHIDHRLAHAAACAAAEGLGVELAFYEDLPYALARYAVGRRLAGLEAQTTEASGGMQGDTPGDTPGGAADAAIDAATTRLTERAGYAAEVRAYHDYLSRLPLTRSLGVVGLRWLMLRVAARAAVAADRPGHRTGPLLTLRAAPREVSRFADVRFDAIRAYGSQWPLFFDSETEMAAKLRQHGAAHGGVQAPVPPLFERFWLAETPANP